LPLVITLTVSTVEAIPPVTAASIFSNGFSPTGGPSE
jgi:hypothetical protein